MCWRTSWQESEAFAEFWNRAEMTLTLFYSLAFVSILLQQSPAHVRLRRASSLCTWESVMLHTGLSLPCSILSVTLRSGRDRRLRPYPCGLILSMGALPILKLLPSSWRRCARSCTVQVPSEQPCLLELADFLDLLVRMLMPMLEERRRDNWRLNQCVPLLRCRCPLFCIHRLVKMFAYRFSPGMWQQSIPDVLWSDKVLRLLCCAHRWSVEGPFSSAPEPRA